MNFLRIRSLAIGFLSALPTVYAVEQLPEKEEDIPVEFVPTYNTSVSFGLHRLTSGPRVRFGNLGHVPYTSPDDTDYPATRRYSNGSVLQDSASVYEQNADGSLIAAGTTRYTTGWISKVSLDSNGNRIVTVYTPVSTAATDSSGQPYVNYQGSYVRATRPVVGTGTDGSTTVTDGNDLVWASTSKFLGYDSTRARKWAVANLSQINMSAGAKNVTMDAYGTASEGESREADAACSSGLELSIDRMLVRRGKWEIGVSCGIQLNQINAKSAGTVWSHLVDLQDVYKIVQTELNSSFYNLTSSANFGKTQPTGTSANLPLLSLSGGSQVYEYIDATTTPYSSITNGDASTAFPLDVSTMQRTIYDGSSEAGHGDYLGEVLVHGFWQVKGSYYLVNIGPSVRYRFNDKWAVSGKLALSLGYVGVTFRADEYFDDYSDIYFYNSAGVLNSTPTSLVATSDDKNVYRTQEKNSTHKLLLGAYGEINAEYWMTERTGLYGGMTMQTMNSFNATPLGGRTANIDFGVGAGWHVGIITRF